MAAEAHTPPPPLAFSEAACDEFDPQFHSWILVPTDDDPNLTSPTTGGPNLMFAASGRIMDTTLTTSTSSLAEPQSSPPQQLLGVETPPPPLPPASSSCMEGPLPAAGGEEAQETQAATPATPSPLQQREAPPAPEEFPQAHASPCILRESIGGPEGEAIAALAVSELLDPKNALTLSPLPPSSADILTTSEIGGKWVPRFAGREESEDAASCLSDEDDDCCALDALRDLGWAWGRPLAILTLLVASHTAVLLIGMHVGRQMNGSTGRGVASGQDAFLTRRFSSGASGIHARLCNA